MRLFSLLAPLLASFITLGATSPPAMADWQALWGDDAPGAPRPPAGTETATDAGRLGRIEQPQYWIHPAPADKRNGKAAVIFPGGGYTILASGHEGRDYAAWLNERGITAMVVKYRVSDRDEEDYFFPVPYLDARRAIRTMRHRAEEFGVDPHQVGVVGSSAGGHLAATCATRFRDTFEEEGRDDIDQQSCRPDFAVLIYPVISMGPIHHAGSRRRLLGEDPSQQAMDRVSLEKWVTARTPRCFLLTTADDRVDCRHSLSFAAACRDAGVPVALHLFEEGGHGYGLNGKGNLAIWPELLEDWLEK